MTAATPNRLAVIGGGMAGHLIAHAMQGTMEVTLIDPKTYVEVPMAVPRLLVEPDALPARIPFTDFLRTANLVRGHATAMSDHSIEVATVAGTKQMVAFDYAVIASGSRYLDPLIKAAAGTDAERRTEIAAAHEIYRSAQNVVIVGGGAVGVEIAAEFTETLPHVKITILEMGKKLLAAAPSKFGGWAERFLKGRDVEVILGDRVVSPSVGHQPSDGVVTTAGGRTIKADAVIWATGVKIATEFVTNSWPEAGEPDGRLKTDTFLRLVGHPNIFVVGDATNLPERRLAIIAGLHAPAVTKNLKALAQVKDPTTAFLTPYKLHPPEKGMGRLMVVTFGRRGGLTSLPFGQFRAAFLARAIKSKDMLVGRVRKGVGLTFT